VAQGGDLTVQASQVAAGHDAVLSGHTVTIAAGVNTASDATQVQWSAGHVRLSDSSQSAAGAGVSAGNNLTVQAVGNGQAGSGDLTVTGATLSAQNGQATLQAAHDLNVGTLALSQSSSAQVHSESHGLLSSGSSTTNRSSSC
jgi:filamentous hemagglutinin